MVLVGPTGVGKTDLSIRLAKRLGAEIVSADSRQFYRETAIGTAPPSKEQLSIVPHHFVGTRSVIDDYTAGKYELDALPLIETLIARDGRALMVGGSGLYIDAVCRGIDEIPATDPELRNSVIRRFESEGIENMRLELMRRDPAVCKTIDLRNPQRVMRALEVCLTTGKPYSELRQNFAKHRNFETRTAGLCMDREELYQRINARVDGMIEAGLVQEAHRLYPLRECNALKTVGYRELFDYFDGKIPLDEAIRLIKRNTRHYAKRQLSWFARYPNIRWFSPNKEEEILDFWTFRLLDF
ncbi:MAG: tRNA (adenosine(37)-N6)-dimethylallyltransferase MiaA [Prevotellaceae bacterium]|nr:tRNA (adenosine(37)-N6)-dimethylallyltransferase MiaA [Prevotellaceae bacterium]